MDVGKREKKRERAMVTFVVSNRDYRNSCRFREKKNCVSSEL